MDIQIKTVDAVTVVELEGRLDGNAAHDIQDQVLPLMDAECRVLVDMSGVEYMSSAGLRVLLLLYRQIEGTAGAVILAGLHPRIRDVMEMTGFLDFFMVVDTPEEGVQALSSY